jgi:hypothetical protein
MDQKKRLSLREDIARGINHGLNNLEIYGQLPTCYPADLIGVIREMMEERKEDTSGAGN